MKIKKDVQKKIDTFAQKRLSHLQAKTFPFEITGCIDDFRRDLANCDIITDEIEDQELTHSEKILMELNPYFRAKEIIRFSSAYFGTEHRYVKNCNSNNGVIYIGHVNNIYAAQIVVDCLTKIASEIREAYMAKLKRYKKQSTKDERADEYVDEWFEELTEKVRYSAWYDTSYRGYFSDYVKKHFKTYEDERKIMLRAIEIIMPIYDIKPDISLTWGEVKKEIFKIYPEKLIKQTIKELDEIQRKDIVLSAFDNWGDEDDEDNMEESEGSNDE